MGRSRSRTPPRRAERRRSRSTSRERERKRRERERSRSRDRDRERRRSRSRSPPRRRSRSPPRRHRSSSPSEEQKEATEKAAKTITISEEDMEGKTEEEIEMMKLMGFGSFDTSKAVHEQKRWFQQTSGLHRLKASTTHCDGKLIPSILVDDLVLFLVTSILFCVIQQLCI
ncbi:U4/U6.U5 small nuclear ribonucleoprotein 27 kDa protein isoform X1 [Pseudoliparis swirei]|uniref:U4/U6.U5 small nuclear ribonucleoprotein 27 kDa protein isoform X1 n=1 Tax=Pseudoliparis swirei TaxID=2059687 RepID=UPI0024BEAD30|nr:U4/U6.U5 small nuclear ribonucleoprotein 27 kDa protein isoform X1 [Pseudoliparis swirei]